VERFCIPPEHSAAFVQAMEDVLDTYEMPYDPEHPVVCFDETSKQLVEHTRTPLPAGPGDKAREDDEYKRCGTGNIFLAVEPLTGKVTVEVTLHRTTMDCAKFLQHVADDVYPDASKIVLVSDNLNTHTASSFYEAFEPKEAHRLARKFEMHHTPKHGSWLNIAECLLSVLGRQCLDQRIGSIEQLRTEVAAWGNSRKVSKVRWQFTTTDARTKLRRLYPIISTTQG